MRAGVTGMLVVSAALIGPPATQAGTILNTFVVNDNGDASDLELADTPSSCDSSAAAGEQCTLRAAIQESNQTSGTEVINFGLPGGGVQTITPTTELPELTGRVYIDGYTQGGASPNTKPLGKPLDTVLRVQLDGTNMPDDFNSDAFTVEAGASGSVISGLLINRFAPNAAIRAESNAVTLTGNFIGTNAAGTGARPNGIGVFGSGGEGSMIGGPDRADRNLISGNSLTGILSNERAIVKGNYIGTAADGRSALGNGGRGVSLASPVASNVVGGPGDEANVIAHNSESGIVLLNGGPGSPFTQNRIFANDEIGIDLGDDGVTANDEGDGDGGPNGLQNFPELDSVKTSNRGTKVKGSLDSTPKETFRIEFFSNKKKERQGRQFIGDETIVTDPGGNASFRFKPQKRVRKGWITATATAVDSGPAGGATSEFSAPSKVR